ncbi:MAG: hypothetical protein QGF09_00465, partial [Rhodospirillales bacterium]|nr:hypothetical protein [Rhodospirillales bacterium]
PVQPQTMEALLDAFKERVYPYAIHPDHPRFFGYIPCSGSIVGILADALAEADSENPSLLIDMATLTGAARVALGTELPALFCNHDDWAESLLQHGKEADDPLWRLPLWKGYRKQLESPLADLTNAPEGGFGGAITAALFLEEFISSSTRWAHLDLMAWNGKSSPGRPEGGEALGIRAIFDTIKNEFDADMR